MFVKTSGADLLYAGKFKNCLIDILYQGLFLIEEGASPVELDQIVKDFGFPMGRFEVRDLSGEWCMAQLTSRAIIQCRDTLQ